MMRRLAWVWLVTALVGCRCGPTTVDPVELGLRVQPGEVDFGRVLEGSVARADVTLTAQTRAAVSVVLETDAPFGAPAEAEVPGGGDTTVSVTFRAGSERVEGTLRLIVGDKTAIVKLTGTGVRPPDCHPSAECVVSTYSLEEDRCVETQAPDDAPCDPASVCLEQGRCRGGQCLGVARRCDDDDRCTDDACAMDVGCVHTPHACPRPTALCQVATCDPHAGCGFGPAPDLDPCGPGDCVEVNICFQGACRTQPTPEGLPCSPAVACLPQAECHSQKCTRVSEADWDPDWSARLPGTPTGALAASNATLFFGLCVDAGIDAGLDGGLDAGAEDGGADAGLDDGGTVDASVPLVCGLSSYTGTGFERFTTAFDDAQPREVLAAGSQWVLLRADGGLELRSSTSGALGRVLPFDGTRAQVAIASDGVFFVSDGGLLAAWPDGGLEALATGARTSELARGEGLFAWDADAGVLTRYDFFEDGGRTAVTWIAPQPLEAPLAVVGDRALLGAGARVRLDADGDAGLLAFDWADAGASRIFAERTLGSSRATDVFFERCDGGACVEWVRGVNLFTGAPLWEGPLLRAGEQGDVVLRTLIDSAPGAVAVLVRLDDGDGGASAEVRLLSEGDVQGVCRLQSSGVVEQALVSSAALVITARRPDGGLALESYGLGGLPVVRTGWPTSHGVGGTRTDGR